jgi:hypothetical protein
MKSSNRVSKMIMLERNKATDAYCTAGMVVGGIVLFTTLIFLCSSMVMIIVGSISVNNYNNTHNTLCKLPGNGTDINYHEYLCYNIHDSPKCYDVNVMFKNNNEFKNVVMYDVSKDKLYFLKHLNSDTFMCNLEKDKMDSAYFGHIEKPKYVVLYVGIGIGTILAIIACLAMSYLACFVGFHEAYFYFFTDQ